MTDRSRYWVLKGKTPRPVNDLVTWAKWFEVANRRVAVTKSDFPPITVSTVFLGIDHGFSEKGLPILFETMIFGGPHDGYQRRCSTWNDAEAMHRAAVAIAEGNAQPCE